MKEEIKNGLVSYTAIKAPLHGEYRDVLKMLGKECNFWRVESEMTPNDSNKREYASAQKTLDKYIEHIRKTVGFDHCRPVFPFAGELKAA